MNAEKNVAETEKSEETALLYILYTIQESRLTVVAASYNLPALEKVWQDRKAIDKDANFNIGYLPCDLNKQVFYTLPDCWSV